jgi:glycerate dehydrogenase
MRIVVLDGHALNPGDNPWDGLAALGRLEVHERTPADLVVRRAAGATIVLTNKTPLTAAVLGELPDLRFVSVLATGYDVVDMEAARRRGIVVSNVPEYGTDSVAQFVFALLLELCHRVGEHDAVVHAGEWTLSADFSLPKFPLVELAGKTMGLVGFGRIGRRTGGIAHALGMEVCAYDPADVPAPSYAPFARAASVEDVFRRSDAVSLHCGLNQSNARMVNERLLSLMKPGAFLINTARGGLVDEEALARALGRGAVAGAALDVVSAEPIRADNPLLEAPRCILTPHIAWASLEARRRLMGTTVENVRAFLAGSPRNTV